jgi:hypothetical protein
MVRLERRLKKHREGGCGQNLLFFFPFENTQCREMQEVVGCREMFQVGAERSGEK